MGKSKKLSRDFFARPVLAVARDCIGKVLVHRTADGEAAGRIVEAEAYRGPRGEPRGEAGRHGQDDAEVPGGLSNADEGRKSAHDASRAFRLRLDEAGRASQAHADEGAFCGRTPGRFG